MVTQRNPRAASSDIGIDVTTLPEFIVDEQRERELEREAEAAAKAFRQADNRRATASEGERKIGKLARDLLAKVTGEPSPVSAEDSAECQERLAAAYQALAQYRQQRARRTTELVEKVVFPTWEAGHIERRRREAELVVALLEAHHETQAYVEKMKAAGVDTRALPWLNCSACPQLPGAIKTSRVNDFIRNNANLLR